MVTAIAITNAGSNLEVTANAEQMPSTCTKIGLFLLRGPKKACFAFADNAIFFYFPSFNCNKKFLYCPTLFNSIASTPLLVMVPPDMPST